MTPLEQLPPATQTGAGTFGCLINGVPYVDNSGNFNCFYQFVDGEYYFAIQANQNLNNITAINLGSLQKEIFVNQNIPLNNYTNNQFYAEISYNNQTTGAWTTNNQDGIINFQRFDVDEKIVSATFSFTIVDEFGFKYEITQGRFDTHFTQ